MTANQIAYQNYLENVRSHKMSEEQARKELEETKRHNVTYEAETARHNLAYEVETNRHNRATEAISVSDLIETERHHRQEEALKHESNAVQREGNLIRGAGDIAGGLYSTEQLLVNNPFSGAGNIAGGLHSVNKPTSEITGYGRGGTTTKIKSQTNSNATSKGPTNFGSGSSVISSRYLGTNKSVIGYALDVGKLFAEKAQQESAGSLTNHNMNYGIYVGG